MEWKVGCYKPKAETGVLSFRSVPVFVRRRDVNNKKVYKASYWFDCKLWIMSGTQIVIDVAEWAYDNEEIPENLSPLYGGK